MNNQSELSLVLRRFHGVFWAIGAFSLAINVLLLVPSLYMLQVYDRVLSSRNMTTLLMLSLIMLGLFALESALEFVRSRVLVRMSVALDVALAPRLFDVSFERYLQSGSGSQALAEHAIEIVADRGISARVAQAQWDAICRRMEAAFRERRFEAGALAAIGEITTLLAQHFPPLSENPDELPNSPVVI